MAKELQKISYSGYKKTDVIKQLLQSNTIPKPRRVGMQKSDLYIHSFYVQPVDKNITIATASHGFEFCAAFQKGNVFGVQFHPEKSHRFGMALIKRFVEI